MPPEKAIFLDFSNTITTVESENLSMEQWLELVREKYNIKPDIRENFKRMRLDKLVDRESKFRTFMEINHEVLSELYGISDIYEENYYRFHEINLRLRAEFIEFIESARKRFQIVMVTDADNTYTWRTTSALGITKYFDSIVTAEMVRAPKPDQRIFRTALKEAHDPSRVIFIGDSERRDVQGAKSMGFFVIKMDDGVGETRADRIVHSFAEVSRIIDAIS